MGLTIEKRDKSVNIRPSLKALDSEREHQFKDFTLRIEIREEDTYSSLNVKKDLGFTQK